MARSKQDPQDDDRKRAFAAALSDAIKNKELTLDQVSTRLTAAGTPASPATLSYWQNGHSMPTRGRSAGVLAVLEHILEVPQGYLTRFLNKGGEAEWRARDVMRASDTVDQVLRDWGLSLDKRVVSVGVQETARIHPDGRTTTSIVRQVVRVDGEVERSMPLVFIDDESGQAPKVSARYGASIGRTHVDTNGTRIIAELVFPKPMRRGEHTWFEYQVEWAPTGEVLKGRNERLLPSLTGLLTLDVVFEGDVPAQSVYWSEPADGSARVVRVLTPYQNAVQVVLPNSAPGTHCIQWSNDPDDPEFVELISQG